MKIASIVVATFACCNEPHVVGLGVGMPPKEELEELIANEERRAGPCSSVVVATMTHDDCFDMCLRYLMASEETIVIRG